MILIMLSIARVFEFQYREPTEITEIEMCFFVPLETCQCEHQQDVYYHCF